MTNVRGKVTLPAELGQEKVVMELAQKWGADVLRDSDGTTLSQEILDMGFDIYSTVCIVRADQSWPREHPTHLPQQFLMSPRVMSESNGGEVHIELMHDYCTGKYRVNSDDDPKKWWEVIDRTSGEVLPVADWDYSNGWVTIRNTMAYHEYTANFLVYQTWDSTSMYNHIINGWTCDKVISLNPMIPDVYEHLMEYFDRWLEEHVQTDVVRLTTLAFHFMLINDSSTKDIIRDWTGYGEAVSPTALREFERVKGYRLRSEDFVDNGYYNITYRPPNERYLDWIDFVHDFVVRFGRELVGKVHAAGKKAAMFWGDHWIGAEPFSPKFQEIGIDIHVGACEDGCALRRISDAPGSQVKELRFFPYFFPDVFSKGGDPMGESRSNWMKIRRALLRKPINRIGWGGYLSLANKFPAFVEHLGNIADEFREFCDRTEGDLAYVAPIKVVVLNAWGKMRSWINQISPSEKFYCGRKDTMEFISSNVLESLAGLPVDLEFISFRDILADPTVLEKFDVIINEGSANSAWSGGNAWANPAIVSAVRNFVYRGGGFIGIGEPTACENQGRFFQLADVLGVQKETGNSIQIDGKPGQLPDEHFITADQAESFNTVVQQSFVFSVSHETQLLDVRDAHVHLAVHSVRKTGKTQGGRGVFVSSLPFNLANARLLHRAIFWAACQENKLQINFSSNPHTDCAFYPGKQLYTIINNTGQTQQTDLFDHTSKLRSLELKPYEIQWIRAWNL